MGQILQQDKIGALSHSAGIITLAPSVLTIGGQQYSTSSLNRTIATDITMTANSRYQIFAVLISGVVNLRISVNQNSVGPAGFTNWKLVGSFYANGMSPVAFGSFVNIKGVPKTENPVRFLSVFRGAVSDPTKGTTTRDQAFWEQNGKEEIVNLEYVQTTVGGAGSGDYNLELPSGHTFDTNFTSLDNSAPRGSLGDCGIRQSGTILIGKCHTGNGANRIWATFYNPGVNSWSSGASTFATANYEISMTDLRFQNTTFSNTPIEDL